MYTFVAYKGDSADYCRGCHMASYSSDFCLDTCLKREEIVKLLAKYTLKNQELKINESGYSVYVFKDGIKFIDDWSVYTDACEQANPYIPETVEYYNYENQMEELDRKLCEEGKMLLDEVVEPLNKLKIQKEQEERIKVQREQEQRRLSQEKQRRAEYEKLKKEFEQQG